MFNWRSINFIGSMMDSIIFLWLTQNIDIKVNIISVIKTKFL